MRLYLSSFRMGDRFGELVAALGEGAKVAVTSNAVDFIPAEDRAAYARNVFDPVEHFRDQGLEAHELDLRDYFGAPDRLKADLSEVRLVWANGGNAFLLRRAMRQSGFDVVGPPRVLGGSLIYGGWSAGAVVAGPSLEGLELMDDPHQLADGYLEATVWEGLGFVDFAIVPHFRSEHPETEGAERAAAWFAENRIPFRPLRDGEVIVL